MGGQATGRRRRRKFWETWAFVGFFLCQQKRASHSGIPRSLPRGGGRPSWREFLCLFVGSAGSVDGARETGRGGLALGSGGEASRVLDVGGRGRGWRAKSEETVVESRERERRVSNLLEME